MFRTLEVLVYVPENSLDQLQSLSNLANPIRLAKGKCTELRRTRLRSSVGASTLRDKKSAVGARKGTNHIKGYICKKRRKRKRTASHRLRDL